MQQRRGRASGDNLCKEVWLMSMNVLAMQAECPIPAMRNAVLSPQNLHM